ncbi:MAG: AMP-binding protein [Microthrixaceae bacterium]
MAGWNFADLWEANAHKFPDATAQVHGEHRSTWQEFDARANGLARYLLDGGAVHQDKVALYLYNGPEYLEGCFAAYKAGLVPVNTNYRYLDDELLYLWDNADAVAVIFHGVFTERVEHLRDRLPGVRHWLWVDDGSGPRPDWADDYEAAAATTSERVEAEWGRSGDDILMIYTGGTTGMPKGVMWRQDDLIGAVCAAGTPILANDPDEVGGVAAFIDSIEQPGLIGLPACPLMHGTGWFTGMLYLTGAGSVVTLTDRSMDWTELLETIAAERVSALTIVGDAFAKPMLSLLDSDPDRWDISSVFIISSSGVMWSEASKQGLLRHNPNMMLIDSFSSSEAIGMGQSVSTGGAAEKTAHFSLGAGATVITDDGRAVEAGSGERGRVAIPGRTPLGYYKDPEKSAATFITFEGVRYSMPGDYATVDADGSISLLGRGSVCINTGGEKVFPEEVEEALKTHETVADAVVVGVPDDKFGEAITAVVEPAADATIDAGELIGHVKAQLAHYKAPKQIVAIDTIGRAPNGKVDYKRMKAYALDELGIDA